MRSRFRAVLGLTLLAGLSTAGFAREQVNKAVGKAA